MDSHMTRRCEIYGLASKVKYSGSDDLSETEDHLVSVRILLYSLHGAQESRYALITDCFKGRSSEVRTGVKRFWREILSFVSGLRERVCLVTVQYSEKYLSDVQS